MPMTLRISDTLIVPGACLGRMGGKNNTLHAIPSAAKSVAARRGKRGGGPSYSTKSGHRHSMHAGK
jgi:hypothetical protein